MSDKSIIQKSKNTLYCTLILVSLGLFGCAMVGSVVPVEKRVELLQTGTIKDIFKSNGLIVEYNYTLTDGSMLLSCSAALSFPVESFDVRLLFLDAQGTVLQQKVVYSSRQRSDEKSLDVPPGTASISFMDSSQPFRGRR
ncbi:MAG: hypothetical protein ACI8PB_000419 [Desulforhopalus sp.]|jgi:hypothetical protein